MKPIVFHLFCATLTLVISHHQSHAVPLMELTGGGPGNSWSGSRTVAGDATAAYFNPALLIETRPHSAIGLSSIWPELRISLEDRPSGYDIADSIYRARLLNEQGLSRLDRRPLPTAELARERSGHELLKPEHTVSIGAALRRTICAVVELRETWLRARRHHPTLWGLLVIQAHPTQ